MLSLQRKIESGGCLHVQETYVTSLVTCILQKNTLLGSSACYLLNAPWIFICDFDHLPLLRFAVISVVDSSACQPGTACVLLHGAQVFKHVTSWFFLHVLASSLGH